MLVALTAATAIATAAVFVVTHGPPGVYTRPAPPEPIGAYRDGGAPVLDPAIEQALAVDLTQLVVVSDGRAGSPDVASGPALHDGVIDRDRLSGLVEPLAARSTAELRTAAAALWTELFGQKLARIVDE